MRVFRIVPPITFTLEKLFTKNLPKSGQARPDAREMFRAFFVAAGAKRKTIELSVRSLCTTARSTDPEVGYKTQHIRQEHGTSTDCAFFSHYFRIAHYSVRIKMSVRTRSRKDLDTIYLLLIYQWWTYSCLLPIAFQMICSTCSP
jgi:hypothetical protein